MDNQKHTLSDARYLKFLCDDYLTLARYNVTYEGDEYETFDDLIEKHPELSDGDKDFPSLMLMIDIETGEVLNWKKGNPQDFYNVKVIDEGKYILMDKDRNVINEYHGYVPDCLGKDGWGDYLEFEIDAESRIKPWEFTQKDFDKLTEEDY